MLTSFQLLVFGLLLIYGFRRLTHWLHRRGWIQWKMRRGSSSALGNAVLGVQTIFQPPTREVVEARLEAEREQRESGDPPEPGADVVLSRRSGSPGEAHASRRSRSAAKADLEPE